VSVLVSDAEAVRAPVRPAHRESRLGAGWASATSCCRLGPKDLGTRRDRERGLEACVKSASRGRCGKFADGLDASMSQPYAHVRPEMRYPSPSKFRLGSATGPVPGALGAHPAGGAVGIHPGPAGPSVGDDRVAAGARAHGPSGLAGSGALSCQRRERQETLRAQPWHDRRRARGEQEAGAVGR
jgi:hypothetical protein